PPQNSSALTERRYRLARRKWIAFGQCRISSRQKKLAEKHINPAEREMRAENETKLNQIKRGKIIKHNDGGHQQRARHQRRARQLPTAAEIQIAVRKKADEPDRQKINCR